MEDRSHPSGNARLMKDRPQPSRDRPHPMEYRPQPSRDRPHPMEDRSQPSGDRPHLMKDRSQPSEDRPNPSQDRPHLITKKRYCVAPSGRNTVPGIFHLLYSATVWTDFHFTAFILVWLLLAHVGFAYLFVAIRLWRQVIGNNVSEFLCTLNLQAIIFIIKFV